MTKKQHLQPGFGLGETIIALLILTLSITAALSITRYVIRTINTSKTEIIASNLASDGIELIRNIRDSNWIYYGDGFSRDKWNELIPDEVPLSGTYVIAICEESGEFCPSLTETKYDAYLYLKNEENEESVQIFTDNNGFLNNIPSLSDQIPSKPRMYREIKIDYLTDDFQPIEDTEKHIDSNAIRVISTVSWKTVTLGPIRSISIQTILTDWYNRKDFSDTTPTNN